MRRKLTILRISIIYFILSIPLSAAACDLNTGRNCKIDDIVNGKIIGNLLTIPIFMKYVCYLIGIYTMTSYLIKLGSNLGDKSGDTMAGSAKAMPFIRACIVSALFISLPTLVSTGVKTFGLDDRAVQDIFNGVIPSEISTPKPGNSSPGQSKY